MKRWRVAILVLVSVASLFAVIRFVVLPFIGAQMVSRLEEELNALGRVSERFEPGDKVRASSGLQFTVPADAQATTYIPDREDGPSTEHIEVVAHGKPWTVIVSNMTPRPIPGSSIPTVAVSGGVAVRVPDSDSGMLAVIDFGQHGRLLVMKSESARGRKVEMSQSDGIALVHEVWKTLRIEGVELP